MAKKEPTPAATPEEPGSITPRYELVEGVSVPPPALYDAEDFGSGFEDFTSDDVAVPFIGILQKQSPQAEEDNPKYIKGAKPGMIFNTVSGELFDGKEVGITVIPVHRVRNFIEWIPKDDGGGLVNVFDPEAPEVLEVLKGQKALGKLKIGDGNDLVETFSVFCLLVKPDGTVDRVVISFASSQIQTYKRWMTMAQNIQLPMGNNRMGTPPMWSHKYRLKTVFTQKKEYTWYKYAVSFDGETAEASRLLPPDTLYQMGKEFRELVVKGRAKAAYETGATREEEDLSGPQNDLDM